MANKILERPIQDKTAIAFILNKTNAPTPLKSAEIAELWSDEAKARAFFSARVMNADILDAMKKRINQVVSGQITDQQARAWIRDFMSGLGDNALQEMGFLPQDDAKLTKDITELGSTRRINLIVEQNVRQAQAVGEYRSNLENRDIFPYLQYNTARDEKVRSSHAVLDGKIYPTDSTIWQEIYPPNGFRCRCFVTPVMADEIGENKISETLSKDYADEIGENKISETLPKDYESEDDYSFNVANGLSQALKSRVSWSTQIRELYTQSIAVYNIFLKILKTEVKKDVDDLI